MLRSRSAVTLRVTILLVMPLLILVNSVWTQSPAITAKDDEMASLTDLGGRFNHVHSLVDDKVFSS